MPGKNIVLKPNQVLFKKNDLSDGMFLLRSGELIVYLEKGDAEISLATVEAGGMVGEMALFDSKPRSACVKALRSSEVTHISQDDFDKLMKQIPKWFTALMITLSKRLRTTNAKVEELTKDLEVLKAQNSDDINSIRRSQDALKVIDHIWQAQGEKVTTEQGRKVFVVPKNPVFQVVNKNLKVDEAEFSEIFIALKAGKLAYESKGKLIASQKNNLRRMIDFIQHFIETNKLDSFPPEIIEILQAINTVGQASAYDPFSASIGSLKEAGMKSSASFLNTWDIHFSTLGQQNDLLKMIKIDDSLGFRLKKKEIQEIYSMYCVLEKMTSIFTS